MIKKISASLVLLIFMVGCGVKGDPLPPLVKETAIEKETKVDEQEELTKQKKKGSP